MLKVNRITEEQREYIQNLCEIYSLARDRNMDTCDRRMLARNKRGSRKIFFRGGGAREPDARFFCGWKGN